MMVHCPRLLAYFRYSNKSVFTILASLVVLLWLYLSPTALVGNPSASESNDKTSVELSSHRRSHSSSHQASSQAASIRFYGETKNSPAAFQQDNLELYVRLNYKRGWNEAKSILLPSMQLFWPHARLIVALDAEQAVDQEAARGIAKEVAADFPPVKARGILIADYPALQGVKGYGGWQRGQLDMMFADTVVKSRYVGFCDTDTVFVTLVSPESIFSSAGKPIIHASLGRSLFQKLWGKVAHTTAFMLKQPFVMSCMSFFPVLLATEHIREMRGYVERIHSKPFIEVYKEMLGMYGYYCHFSIMCNYMWYFKRDKYEWRYQNYVKNQSGWDAARPHEIHNFSFLTTENVSPYIRISSHFTYINFTAPYDMPWGSKMESAPPYGHLKTRFDPHIAGEILTNGFCYVSLAQCHQVEECATFKNACSRIGVTEDKLQVLLFRFEIWQTWEWDRRVIDGQRQHYAILKNYVYWIPYGKMILSKYQSQAFAKLQL